MRYFIKRQRRLLLHNVPFCKEGQTRSITTMFFYAICLALVLNLGLQDNKIM